MTVIRDLIDRMRQGDFEQAREEASQIADLAVLRQIQAILEQSTDDAEKMYCYWMLGDLGRNTKAPQVADYLMERVAAEKKARLRQQALVGLIFLHCTSSAANVIAALQDKNRDVRSRAIDALGACSDPKAEEALVGIVTADNEPAATRQATAALVRIGTARCVNALVSLFRRLPRDRMYESTVAAALLALARVGPTHSLPLAVEELGASRSTLVNLACMLVIEQHGNEAQIDVVVSRLKAFIAKKNRQDMVYATLVPFVDPKYGDELTAGVSFLQRFADARVDDLLTFLRTNLHRLYERERSFLAAGVKDAEPGRCT